MTLQAIKTAATTQNERLVALIHDCTALANSLADGGDAFAAAHVMNAVLDLQRARPKCVTAAEDRERLETARRA